MTYLQQLQEIQKNGQNIALVGIGNELKSFYIWLKNEIGFENKQIFLFDQNYINFDSIIEKEAFPEENIYQKQNDFQQIFNIPDLKLIFKAPGIWSEREEFVKFRNLNKNNSVLSSLTYILEKARNRIIGVTGTKGKTTTCSLIHHFLKQKIQIEYCGNSVGVSPYKFWNDDTSFIIELSSFQLHDLGRVKISPRFSILTNLYIDHQDVHKTVDEYWQAKVGIFKYQLDNDVFLLHEDTYKNSFFPEFENKSVKIVTENIVQKMIQTFPSKLIGTFNYRNLTQAMIISDVFLDLNNLPNKDIEINKNVNTITTEKITQYQNLVDSFTPVKYRIELVHSFTKENISIRFYNDAQGTTVESTVNAILSLSEKENELLILIVGGKKKVTDISVLTKAIKEKIQNHKLLDWYAFDEIGTELKKEIQMNKANITNNTKDFFLNNTLDIDSYIDLLEGSKIDIVNVLMSPAGSSLNEFKNYIEKGEAFNTWAKKHF
jgi:UDP-N-acetylmuramoylalanine-D-glutamate ligase